MGSGGGRVLKFRTTVSTPGKAQRQLSPASFFSVLFCSPSAGTPTSLGEGDGDHPTEPPSTYDITH